jgi:hypothetical protein
MSGILLNDKLEQLTLSSPASHQHPSGHRNATLAGRISDHIQNISTAKVSTSDNTTATLDGLAKFFNLHRKGLVSVCVQYF